MSTVALLSTWLRPTVSDAFLVVILLSGKVVSEFQARHGRRRGVLTGELSGIGRLRLDEEQPAEDVLPCPSSPSLPQAERNERT